MDLGDVISILRARADELAAWAEQWEGRPEVGEARCLQVLAQVQELRKQADGFEAVWVQALVVDAEADA